MKLSVKSGGSGEKWCVKCVRVFHKKIKRPKLDFSLGKNFLASLPGLSVKSVFLKCFSVKLSVKIVCKMCFSVHIS